MAFLRDPVVDGTTTPTVTFNYWGARRTIAQIRPTAKFVTAENSNDYLSDQLAVSGSRGAVADVVAVSKSNSHVAVTPSGAIAVRRRSASRGHLHLLGH